MTDKDKDNKDPFSFDLTQEDLNEIQIKVEKAPALASEEDATKVVAAVAKKHNCSMKTAVSAMYIICQKGGTARKAQPNIYATVNGTRIDLGSIRECITKLKISMTLRQFARTYATQIYTISAYYGVDGDLCKKAERIFPNILQSEKYWISNFQMDNPDCPQNIRNYLVNHFNMEIRPNTKPSYPNAPGYIPRVDSF
jgi:hypothetical protein